MPFLALAFFVASQVPLSPLIAIMITFYCSILKGAIWPYFLPATLAPCTKSPFHEKLNIPDRKKKKVFGMLTVDLEGPQMLSLVRNFRVLLEN